MGDDDTGADPPSGRGAWSRRAYLVATTGSATGLAGLSGCVGGNGDGADGTETIRESETPERGTAEEGADEEEADEEEHEELPEGVTREAFERGPVPEAYRTALSLGGEARNPADLFRKSEVGFAEFEEARENSAHRPGTCCANCADYIPDKNGDEYGACAEVEGYIDREDWCTVYEALPEPSVPEGMAAEDLPTAEVPEPYRTASSQGGEERDPDDLLTQADANVMESVEAIADGVAMPGQSCGNCAEFIPDRNGDTWGACARVEGYIAVEDWCAVWEHVSEEL
ncbi:MAG: high-potential iron-sulfur protein [Haloarculaceae archaeon]